MICEYKNRIALKADNGNTCYMMCKILSRVINEKDLQGFFQKGKENIHGKYHGYLKESLVESIVQNKYNNKPFKIR